MRTQSRGYFFFFNLSSFPLPPPALPPSFTFILFIFTCDRARSPECLWVDTKCSMSSWGLSAPGIWQEEKWPGMHAPVLCPTAGLKKFYSYVYIHIYI